MLPPTCRRAEKELRRPGFAPLLGVTVFLLLLPGIVQAQWSASAGALSDFRFRGVSLSDRKPSLQVSGAYDHASGLFAGGQATTVDVGYDHERSRLLLLAYAGYARRLTDLWSVEAGGLWYSYPDNAHTRESDFGEAFAGVTRGAWSARAFHSRDYLGQGSRSWYLQAGWVHALSDDWSLFVQAGRQWRPDASAAQEAADAHRRTDARVGVQYVWRRIQFEASVVGNDISDGNCPETAYRCRTGVTFGAAYLFP